MERGIWVSVVVMSLRLHRCGSECFGCGVDCFARDDLGCAPERRIFQLGIPTTQLNASDNLLVQEALAPRRGSFFSLEHEFVESWCALEEQLGAGLAGEPPGCVSRLGQVVLGEFADAFFAI